MPSWQSGERLVAFFEPDLDGQLEFADGLVVLTDRRLLTLTDVAPRGKSGAIAASPAKWRSWPIKRRHDSADARSRRGLG